MKKLIPLILILLVFSCAKQNTTQAIFERASMRHKVPLHILYAVAQKETRFNHNFRGTSGEIGMMQIMPYHVKRCRCNLRDLACNVNCGASYIRNQYERNYSISDALARYNAGWYGERSAVGRKYAQDVLTIAKEYT